MRGLKQLLVYIKILFYARYLLLFLWKLSLVSAIMVALESFYMQMIFMSNNLEDLKIQLQAWGTSLDIQSLRVSIRKTKILGSSGKAQKATSNFKWSCGVCSKGVGVNSILYQTCNLWIHKRCSGLKGTLKKESMFRCKKCKGESTPNGSLNSTLVYVSGDIRSCANFSVLWWRHWRIRWLRIHQWIMQRL